MDLVKKVIVLVCSIILVGFTLTDFHSVIAEDPAYDIFLSINRRSRHSQHTRRKAILIRTPTEKKPELCGSI